MVYPPVDRSGHENPWCYLDGLQGTSIDQVDLINGVLHYINRIVAEIDSCSNDALLTWLFRMAPCQSRPSCPRCEFDEFTNHVFVLFINFPVVKNRQLAQIQLMFRFERDLKPYFGCYHFLPQFVRVSV